MARPVQRNVRQSRLARLAASGTPGGYIRVVKAQFPGWRLAIRGRPFPSGLTAAPQRRTFNKYVN